MTNLTHTSPEQPAAALAVEPSKVILPQQYPAWTDGHGWNQPQQYKTIQVGDIDGDGIDELIGRGPNGIEVYKWGPTTHIWEQLSGVGPFSDKDGWTTPQRYLNIILADINGDKNAELIGLNEHKLQAYSWDATQHVWNELSVNAALPSSWAWDANSTIQAADIDGDGKAELVLRVTGSLWKIAWSDSKQWSVDETPGLAGLPADTTILLGDLDGDGKSEIVTSDTSGIRTYRWVGKEMTDYGPTGKTGEDVGPVQLADVNGDGKAELISQTRSQVYSHVDDNRWYRHLNVYRLATPNDGWFQTVNMQAYDLYDPEYVSTVQFADIDGDGKAEMIGRSHEGLIAFRFHPVGVGVKNRTVTDRYGIFNQIATAAGVMADADGWNAPQCYLTIQTARIGGGGKGFAKFAVIGRGPDGIQTWQWSADTGPANPLPGGAVAKLGFRTTAVNGFHQPTEPGFPDYSGPCQSNSPGKLCAYQLLSQYLLDVVADVWPPAVAKPQFQDIRAQYTNTAWMSHWVSMVDKLAKLEGKQVEHIPPDDFETVLKQLHTELIYVDCAYTWFNNTKDVLNRLFPADEATVTLVQGRISIPPDYTVKVILDIASVVAAIVGAIVAVVTVIAVGASEGTLAPVAIPAIAAVTALISLSLRIGSSYAGNGGKALELEVRHVRETLLDNWMRAPLANDHLLEVFLQHWGFLRQLGEKITALQLVWPPSLTSTMVAQGRRAYELSVWKTLSQSTWMVIGYNWPKERNAGVPKYGFWYEDNVHQAKWLLIQSWKGIGRQYNDIKEETLERVFGQPDEHDSTSPLGVPVEDVMLARNGWKLPYDTGYDLPLPPPPEDPTLLLRPRPNPSPRRLT